MTKSIYTLLVIALAVTSAQALKAQEQVKTKCNTKESTLSYSMSHPLHDWTGTSKEVNAIIVSDAQKKIITQVAASVKIASFDSKNANRDSHTIEVTEAIKYPAVTFSSTAIADNGEKLLVKGNLTFHGVTNPIAFEAVKKHDGGKTTVTGIIKVKMTDYKITPPSLMGLSTEDEFTIDFNMVF